MKYLIVIAVFLLIGTFDLTAQAKNIVSDTFTVYGNCGMCKRTIEKSASIKGVKSVDWSVESNLISITYDASVVNLETIKKATALSGYDTVDCRATNEAYNKLHGCCQYERPQPLKSGSQ